MKKQSRGILISGVVVGSIVTLGMLILLQDLTMPLFATIFLAGCLGLTAGLLMSLAVASLTPDAEN